MGMYSSYLRLESLGNYFGKERASYSFYKFEFQDDKIKRAYSGRERSTYEIKHELPGFPKHEIRMIPFDVSYYNRTVEMDNSKFLFDGEYLINVNADSSVVLPLGDTFDIDVPFTDGPNGRVMRLYKNGTGEYRIKKDGKFLERKFSHTLFKYKRTKKYLTIYYDDYSKEIYYINHGRINTCTYIAAQFERQMLGEIGVPVYRPTALDMGTHVAKGKLFKLKHSQNRMIYETLLSVCGIFIILGLILNFLGVLNKRCNYSGCKEYKTYNSSYCIKHTKKVTGYTYSSGSSKKNSKKETKTYNTSSKSSGSKYYDSDYYNTKSYKSGEEFADDWADDFDEDDYDDYDEAWDEAYDYWNDN